MWNGTTTKILIKLCDITLQPAIPALVVHDNIKQYMPVSDIISNL